MALFAEPQADDGVERIVRINCVREAFGLADVQAVLASDTPPPALMLPKVRTPDEVVWLDDLLSERGHDTRLHVIIETNPGLEAAFEIAHCSDRLDALFFGGVDMAAELALRQRLGAAALRPIAGRARRGLGGARRDRRPVSGPGRPAGHGDRGETGSRPRILREGRDSSQADSGPQRGVHARRGADRAGAAHHPDLRGGRHRSGRHRRQAHREAGVCGTCTGSWRSRSGSGPTRRSPLRIVAIPVPVLARTESLGNSARYVWSPGAGGLLHPAGTPSTVSFVGSRIA